MGGEENKGVATNRQVASVDEKNVRSKFKANYVVAHGDFSIIL